MKKRISKNNTAGFTLIELMVLVAIIGLVLIVGVPNYKSMVLSNRLTSVSNELMMSFKLARSEAITRGTTVSICHSNDGASCSGAGWHDGWIVFANPGAEPIAVFNAPQDELLWVRSWDPGSTMTVTGNPIQVAADINYSNTGVLTLGAQANFIVCSGTNNTPQLTVRVSATGDSRVFRTTPKGTFPKVLC